MCLNKVMSLSLVGFGCMFSYISFIISFILDSKQHGIDRKPYEVISE